MGYPTLNGLESWVVNILVCDHSQLAANENIRAGLCIEKLACLQLSHTVSTASIAITVKVTAENSYPDQQTLSRLW